MASDVFFNRVPYTQRRIPPPPHHQPHDPLSTGNAAATTHLQRSIGTTRSAGALTFPPLYLDPVDPHNPNDPASNQHAANPSTQQPGSFVLGSTFYHHPELNALVSNHLVDASANALDGASGTGHAFLSSIFASRDGGAHDDDSDADEAAVGGADTAVAVPRPKVTSEFVSLNEDLVPASLDMHGDMLPADQHPSYPFGNLFGPLGGMIAADSAIVGGVHSNTAGASASLGAGLGDAAATLGLDFGGGLDGFINLGHSSHGRRSAVSNAWNSSINKASRSKLVGSAGANTEWNLEAHQHSSTTTPAAAATSRKDDEAAPSHLETIRAAKKLDLSPNLLFRTYTSTVLAPPTWPFRQYGPGSTSYAALLRPSSNIFGTSPASQAVAATLGGLPASSRILKEVWSDLALEQLVPIHVGETSAVRHINADEGEQADEAVESNEKRGKKRARTDPEPDNVFAKRLATLEPDPLDLLGPISREIRGQANQPWGTATSRADRAARRRRRSTYSDQSADEAVEAEADDDGSAGYAQRDRLRYSFALPPANFSWVESGDEEDEEPQEPQERVEPDGIGWSTAKRIFVNEERDRLLAGVASRGAGEVEAYRVRGVRGNAGVVPRAGWSWGDAPSEVEDGGNESCVTEMSASGSRQSLREGEGQAWEQEGGEGEAEDEELQRALLMQYQQEMDAAEDEVVDQGEEEEEAQVEYDLDAHYSDRDDDVESFEDDTA